RDEMIGALMIDSTQPGFYTEADAAIAQALANQAAVAIENARLYQAEQRGREIAEALQETARVVNTSLNLEEVLPLILEQLAQVIEYDSSAVLLLDNDRFKVTAGRGFPDLEAALRISFNADEDNLSSAVMHARRPLIIEDVQADPRWRPDPGVTHIHGWIGAPLIARDRVTGILNVDSCQTGAYSEKDGQLVFAFAAQAAIAIENARLFEEVKRRAEEMTALHETTLDITAELEMPRLLNAIIARASDLLGATGGLIHLCDPARERLAVVTSHNLEKDYTGLMIEVGEGVAGKVFQTGEPLIIDDHRTWAGKSSQVADADARSMLGVPLKWRERILGVLDIMDNVRAGAFDEHDLWLLMPFANQAAIAIQNARLFEEAKQRARQLEALAEVGRAIGSTLNLDEVLQLILGRLEDVVPYDTVSLWLREGEAMCIRAVQGFERYDEAHLGLTVTIQDDPLSQEMVSTQRPLILADARQDERFHGLAGTEWVCSWLGVPLLGKGEVIGLVTLNKKEPGLYTAEMAELALAFGQQAAMAIENARLYEETKQRAE
ncbi:MAG: GAF domain-containing protein, partial [Anaerolineae bacterium]|nr:GAF domain-containing protein [Anaerolineae bacterium]